MFGRGVHAQLLVRAKIINSILLDNRDAGIFSLLVPELVVADVIVNGVGESDISGVEDELSSDGIVITTGDPTGTLFDSELYTADVTRVTVSGFERVGILLEGVDANMDQNTALDGAGIESMQSHNAGTVATSNQADVLPAAAEYPLFREAIALPPP